MLKPIKILYNSLSYKLAIKKSAPWAFKCAQGGGKGSIYLAGLDFFNLSAFMLYLKLSLFLEPQELKCTYKIVINLKYQQYKAVT